MKSSQPPRHWHADRAHRARVGNLGRLILIIGMTALVFVLTIAAGSDTIRKMRLSAGPVLVINTTQPPPPVETAQPATPQPVLETQQIITETPGNTFTKPPRCKVEGKIAYLTFDDGPEIEITPRVLDVLKAYNVPGTFFIVGNRLTESEAGRGLVRRMDAEGHAIGFHSHTHRAKQSYSDFIYASPSVFSKQFPLWESAVREALGYDLPYKVMRFPNGSSNRLLKPNYLDLLSVPDAAGYLMFDWNVLTNDAQSFEKPQGVSLLDFEKDCFLASLDSLEQRESGEPAIVLMHDIFYGDTLCQILPWMIDTLRERGYTFGRCDQLPGSYLH
ncbi:MAG: polysaccharide deacetylase family protein [Clostridia bacterium]|nr:polysaccharide deacetylase family protein [Clostridia bacterium]